MAVEDSNQQFVTSLPTISARRAWLWFSGAFAVAVLLFAQGVDFPLLPTWDDGVFVVERPEVQNWWQASWRERLLTPEIGYPLPVPTFIYAHVQIWFGEQAFRALHVLNLGLHLVNAVLVFRLVCGWFGRRIGAVTASLWVVHPIVVESVMWLTNLKTVLAATFLLAAMNVWEETRRKERPREALVGYTIIAIIFAMAAGCRPDAAIVPAVLAVQCMVDEEPMARLRRHGLFLVPLTVVAGAYATMADTAHDEIVERSVFFDDGIEAVVARVFHALEIAAKNLVWPADLHPAYFQQWREGVLDAMAGIGIFVAVVAIVAALMAAGRRRRAFPFVLAGVLYAPFSNIVFLPRFTADTYLYLVSFAAMTGVVLLVDLVLRRGAREWVSRPSFLPAATVVVVAVFGLYAWSTHHQIQRWEDPISLWSPVIEDQPRAHRPYRHIAWEYARRGDFETSREVLEKAYPIFRNTREIPAMFPEMLAKTGDPERAVEVAVEAMTTNRDVESSHHRVYLETLVSHAIALPDAPEVLEVTREAVDVYLEHDDWTAQENVGMGFGAYFLEQGHPELAAPFIELALAEEAPPCAAWYLVDALPEPLRDEVDASSAPERCKVE